MANAFLSQEMQIEPAWIDYNGHLNMAYYSVLFDRGVDDLQEAIGLGPDYLARTGCTTYTAEFRIRYLRELHLGARLTSSVYVLDVTPKAYHFAQELIHHEGWVAATGEGISLHVDQSGERPTVAPYPDAVLRQLEAMQAAHAGGRPDFVGRPMGLRR